MTIEMFEGIVEQIEFPLHSMATIAYDISRVSGIVFFY
jgi:hypothetical protein